jgi:hypothetical protein
MVATLMSGSTLFAQESYSLQELKSDLNQLRESYQAAPQSKKTIAQLQALNEKYDLSRWIGEVPSSDWASPSAQRLARINEIADAISPYNSMLIDLAFGGSATSHTSSAMNLLWYSKGGDDLKYELLQVADRQPMAYQMLFELGLFDQEVRQKYCKGFSMDPNIRKERASMASDWGLVEALPVYKELLEQDFDPRTISFVGEIPADNKGTLKGYKIAANGIMHLGSAAGELLSLLKKRISEIKLAFPDRYRPLTGDLQSAMNVLEGKTPQFWETAVDGRGFINLMNGPSPRWGGGPSSAISLKKLKDGEKGNAFRSPMQVWKSKILTGHNTTVFLIIAVAFLVLLLVSGVRFLTRRNRH